MRISRTAVFLFITIFLVGILAGCKVDPSKNNIEEIEPDQSATETATEAEQKVLSICLGREPETLYFYKGNGHSMWSVLEAIYDGPIDMINYNAQPVILESIPSLENLGVSLQPVPVQLGQVVVDVNGNTVVLEKDMTVFPSGCTSLDCAVLWDGETQLTMDRMIANYLIKPGVKWSDGEALTADDSVFSYTVAGDPATPVSKTLYNQTEAYQALDARTVQWIGRPGLITNTLENFFWIPLPKHVLQNYSAKDLLTAVETNSMPIGWGAFMIDEWVPGDHIRLVKNPYYFRTAEDLPKFDVVVYRFVGNDAESNLIAFQNGECKVIDQSVAWESDYEAVSQLELSGSATVYKTLGPEWEHLDFGIKPASYDDGYNPFGVDRPNYFGDVRVRQAFASCIDRQDIVTDLFRGLTQVPLSYLAPTHPYYVEGLTAYPYDPARGVALLEEAGWKDLDGDPSTPRAAIGISDISNGTTFTITLITGQVEIRQEVARRVAADLQACGIKVDVLSLPNEEFHAAAPTGALFGRHYDLAEFAWAAGTIPPCFIYMSNEIPGADNNWSGQKYGGVNTMGYGNPELDAACQASLVAGAAPVSRQENQATVQTILAKEVPSIPLFYFVNVAVSRSDICGMSLDASMRSEFWNIEAMDMSTDCANSQ